MQKNLQANWGDVCHAHHHLQHTVRFVLRTCMAYAVCFCRWKVYGSRIACLSEKLYGSCNSPEYVCCRQKAYGLYTAFCQRKRLWSMTQVFNLTYIGVFSRVLLLYILSSQPYVTLFCGKSVLKTISVSVEHVGTRAVLNR